jgi:PAS domain S-box-containing protein
MTQQSDKRKRCTAESAMSPVARRRYTAEIDHVGADVDGGAVIELDKNGFITLWSPRAEQLYGYDAEEMLSKHVSSLYCNGELEQGRAAHELNAIARRKTYNVFGWQMRKGGQQFWTYTQTMKTANGSRLIVIEKAPHIEERQKDNN